MEWNKTQKVIGSLSAAILLGFVPFSRNAYWTAGLLIFGVFLAAIAMRESD